MQLDVYDTYNKMLRVAHSDGHNQRAEETRNRMGEVIEERKKYLNSSEGESLSTDDI